MRVSVHGLDLVSFNWNYNSYIWVLVKLVRIWSVELVEIGLNEFAESGQNWLICFQSRKIEIFFQSFEN